MENSESEKMIITGTMVSKVCSILGIVICVSGLILDGSTTWQILLLCNSSIFACTYAYNEAKKESSCAGKNNEKNKKVMKEEK